jgi:hypothetical protein
MRAAGLEGTNLCTARRSLFSLTRKPEDRLSQVWCSPSLLAWKRPGGSLLARRDSGQLNVDRSRYRTEAEQSCARAQIVSFNFVNPLICTVVSSTKLFAAFDPHFRARPTLPNELRAGTICRRVILNARNRA